MQIDRLKADTRHLDALAAELNALQGPCVGCRDCAGLCPALIEALFVPELVLGRRRSA